MIFLIAALLVYEAQYWTFYPDSTLVIIVLFTLVCSLSTATSLFVTTAHFWLRRSPLRVTSSVKRNSQLNLPARSCSVPGQEIRIYSSPHTKNRVEVYSCVSILPSPAISFQKVIRESSRRVRILADIIMAGWVTGDNYSSRHQISCLKALEGLHLSYRAALSQQYCFDSFTTLRVASYHHSPGLRCTILLCPWSMQFGDGYCRGPRVT
jgi:hypothetical protein